MMDGIYDEDENGSDWGEDDDLDLAGHERDCVSERFGVVFGSLSNHPYTSIALKHGTELKFPLREDELGALSWKMNTTQMIDVVDEQVKGRWQKWKKAGICWELKAGDFKIQNNKWESFIRDELVSLLWKGFASAGVQVQFRAHPFSLTVGRRGSSTIIEHNVEGLDNDEGHFGTLMIQLPSKFSGGQIRIKDQDGKLGQEIDFSSKGGEEEFGTFYAAFQNGCNQESLPISDGVRCVLIYKLAFLRPNCVAVVPAIRRSILAEQMGVESVNCSVGGLSSLNYSHGGGGDVNATALMSNGLPLSLETYGTPLPAMVTVAINSCNGESFVGGEYSCRLDANGWGWLVTGRKLYVWQYGPENGKKNVVDCRKLMLPPSLEGHHANLVVVLATATTGPCPSVLVVSPQGYVTYWPSISNESDTLTLNVDISGQWYIGECDSLTSIWPVGCIVTTTRSTVFLIKISSDGGTLVCAPLMAQKGWLRDILGWCKKMNILLGDEEPVPRALYGYERVRVIVPMSKDDDPMSPGNNKDGKVYIFEGFVVQTWKFNENALVWSSEIYMEEHLKRQLIENFWDKAADVGGRDSHTRDILTWILDTAHLPDSKQLAVLVAGVKNQNKYKEKPVYGIVTFDVKRFLQGKAWSFIPLCNICSSIERGDIYAWKLLTTQSHYFVISQDGSLIAVVETDGLTDAIESGTQLGGPIISAGNVEWNTVVVLMSKWGLLSIKPAAALVQDGFGMDETFSEVETLPLPYPMNPVVQSSYCPYSCYDME